MEKQKTPCQILIEWIDSLKWGEIKTYSHIQLLDLVMEKSKQLKANEEREMIIEAYKSGKGGRGSLKLVLATEYYSQKYGEK